MAIVRGLAIVLVSGWGSVSATFALVILLAGTVGQAALPAPSGAAVEHVASLPDAMLNGVAVSPEGRIFISLPRWGHDGRTGVAELQRDGSLRPFPNEAWNSWRIGDAPASKFVSVHATYADKAGNLWVVDEGPPTVASTVKPSPALLPKLVQIRIATGKILRVYPIGRNVAPAGSNLGHLRVDARYIYVSEPGQGSLVIVDRRTGAQYRRLASLALARSDPAIVPVIGGAELRVNGEVPQVHLDLLELDRSGTWLYFMPLFGPNLYRIRVAELTNWALSDAELAQRIEVVAETPPSTGMTKDVQGRFYICSITQMGIARLTSDGRWETVAIDPRLYLPNEPSFGPDGWLYFPVSRPLQVPDIGVNGPPSVFRVKAATG